MSSPIHAHSGGQTPARGERSHLLHLGCGEDYRPGWLNVDVSPEVEADEYLDLDDRPWPWPDDAFVRVAARHVLEHLADPLGALAEIARVLTPGGTLVLTYPIGHTRFEDPTHQHYWSVKTAEHIAGDAVHSHETRLPYRLVDTDVQVETGLPSRLQRLRVAYYQWRYGPGPWVDQLPGVYGEVTATYRRTDDGGM